MSYFCNYYEMFLIYLILLNSNYAYVHETLLNYKINYYSPKIIYNSKLRFSGYANIALKGPLGCLVEFFGDFDGERYLHHLNHHF